MTIKNLAILGSSRSDGHTAQALKLVINDHDVEIVDLNDLEISFFDYDHLNQNDDFQGLSEKMAYAETILFATPVYWYAMSAQMKMFFDRLSDLLQIAKPIGRSLIGRRGAFLSVGTDVQLPNGYEVPFKKTCEYFEMVYEGGLYLPVGKSLESETIRAKKIQEFSKKFWNV